MDTVSLVIMHCKSPNDLTGKIDKATAELEPVAGATRGQIQQLERETALRRGLSG